MTSPGAEAAGTPHGTLLDAPAWARDQITQAVPDLTAALDRVTEAVRLYLGSAYPPREGAPASYALILSQATNDFIDLLYDVACGRGRPALRAARGLFDLLLAALDVHADADADRRYEDHRWVAAHVESGIDLGEELLAADERAAEEARRAWYRQASQATYERLTSKPPQGYGPAYRKQWATRDLRQRADSHELAGDYELYRFASAVLHGAAGGGFGLETLAPDWHPGGDSERPVVRTGPALALCPYALLMGLRWYRRLIVAFATVPAGPIRAQLDAALAGLEGLWPTYRRALLDFDAAVWPTEAPPPALCAVVTIAAQGAPGWYLYDTRADRVIRADLPTDLSEDDSRRLRYLVHATQTAVRDGGGFPPGDRFPLALLDVLVPPAAGAAWQPTKAVLPEGAPVAVHLAAGPLNLPDPEPG